MAVEPARGASLRLRRVRPRLAARDLLAAEAAPLAVTALGALLVAALAATVGVKIGAVALDETLIKQSAVHYGTGLPGTLFHDLAARGTSRLYSLLLAPFFVAFDGDVGVRVARAFNALLFCSAAIPAHLLAVRVLGRRWLAVVPALLSVATPWLILSTALYTENLAFPLFVWSVWAMERAVREPAPGRDLLALVSVAALVCTRTQFGVLFAAYGLCAAAAPLLRGGADALPLLGRRAWRGHPFTVALFAAGVLALLYLVATGGLHREVQALFGSYSEIQDRGRISSDMSIGLLVELAALSLGLGLLPAIAALAWFGGALTRPARPEWTFALVATVVTVIFGVATIYAQGGWLEIHTEERYYFYVVPLLWIGAIAAVSGPAGMVTRRALITAGGALALLVATVPLAVAAVPEWGFLAPVLSSVQQLLPRLIDHLGIAGLSGRDLLFALAALGTAALALAWTRAPGRWAVAVALPVAVQLVLAVYPFHMARDGVGDIGARTGADFAAAGWIDRALPADASVTWLDNQPVADPPAVEAQQRTALFFNDQIEHISFVPALGLPPVTVPLSTLPTTDTVPDPRTGALGGTPPAGLVVQQAGAPHLQVAGRRIAASADGLELLDAGATPRLRWAALRLPADGTLAAGRPARFVAAAPVPGRATRVAVTLTAPAGDRTRATIRVGRETATVALPKGDRPQATQAELTACLGADRPARASIVARTPLALSAVTLTPTTTRCPTSP